MPWKDGIAEYSASIAKRGQNARFIILEQRLAATEEKLRELAEPGAITFSVATFAPEPYAVKQPFGIVVWHQPEGFIASFVDANINSSGDTQQEAFANTKELILDTFDRLNSLPANKLGPGPKRQLAVLREFIIHVPTNNQAGRPEDRQET